MNKTMDDDAFNYLLERLESILATPNKYWVNKVHRIEKDRTNIVCDYVGSTGLKADCSHPLSLEQILYLYENYSIFLDIKHGAGCYFHIIPIIKPTK